MLVGIVLITQVFVDDRLLSELHTASCLSMWQGWFPYDGRRLRVVHSVLLPCAKYALQQLSVIYSCYLAVGLKICSKKLAFHILHASRIINYVRFAELKVESR